MLCVCPMCPRSTMISSSQMNGSTDESNCAGTTVPTVSKILEIFEILEWLNWWEQLCWVQRVNHIQNIGTSSHVPTKSYPFYILSIVCWEYKRTMKQSKVIQEILARFDDDVARLNTFNASKTGGESIRLKQYGSSWVTINVLVQT